MRAARAIGERALTPRQLELLGMLRIEKRWAYFTGPQIPDWNLLKSALEALGGSWSRKRQGFWWRDGVNPQELIGEALASGAIIDPKAAEFFATPAELARQIVKLADIRPGALVLEPSAGEGSLVRAIIRQQPEVTIWAWEAVGVLLMKLTGSRLESGIRKGGLNPVHGDFLLADLGVERRVDRVVMNPPFSKGQDIEHVTHALTFLKPDGLLVAIMSAGIEFRDDHRTREFRGLLDELGGTIARNPEGSFKPSGTEVRTVTVWIPMPEYVAPELVDDGEPEPEVVEANDGFPEESPDQEPNTEDEREPSDTTLARRLSIREIVAVYEQAELDIRAGFGLIHEAETRLTQTFAKHESDHISVRDRHNYRAYDFSDVESCLQTVRRAIWWALVDRLEIKRVMSITAWKELEGKLRDEREPPPPIDCLTIEQMVMGFEQRLPEMAAEAIKEVFKWLVPRRDSWWGGQYKTNDDCKIGPKIIVTSMIECWYGEWRVKYDSEQRLTALENVFRLLDGQGQRTREHYSEISLAIKALPKKAERCEGETTYFKFKGFRNGNLHMAFRRLDLVAKLNAVAGGKRFEPKKEVA